MIRLRVLGPVDLRGDDGMEFRNVLAQPKRLALLVTLVVGPPGFRRRDSLLALLWPELDQAHARAALNQAVRFLRREFGGSTDAGILSRGAEEIGIDDAAIWCDAMEFRDHVEAGRYQDALSLYRGNLLEGFFVEQGGDFQDWLERERDLLRLTAAKAARSLVGVYERDGDHTPAVAAARRAVDLAAGDERAVRELLQLLDRLGDRAGALQAYQDFARRLETDFGVSPAPETQALIQDIRNGTRLGKSVPGKTLSEQPGRGHELPNVVLPSSNGPDAAEAGPSVTPVASEGREDGAGHLPGLLVRRSPWLLAGAVIGAGVARCGT